MLFSAEVDLPEALLFRLGHSSGSPTITRTLTLRGHATIEEVPRVRWHWRRPHFFGIN
jgi:hypothetical protein